MQFPSAHTTLVASSYHHIHATVATRIKPALSSQKVAASRYAGISGKKDSRAVAELTARRGKRGGRRKSAIIQESARTRSAVRTEEKEKRDVGRDPAQDEANESPSSASTSRLFPPPSVASFWDSDRVFDQRGVLIAFAEVLLVPPQRENRDFRLFLRSIFGRIGQLVSAARERTILHD